MNDRLIKLKIALAHASNASLGRIAKACLDAWSDVDSANNKEDESGYEVGFYTTATKGSELSGSEAWIQMLTGSRDFCVGVALGRQMDCDIPEYYRVRSKSGFEVWPIWGRGFLDNDGGEDV